MYNLTSEDVVKFGNFIELKIGNNEIEKDNEKIWAGEKFEKNFAYGLNQIKTLANIDDWLNGLEI